MAENIDEVEELQLRLESEICGLSVEALNKFAQHVEVNAEGLRKIQIAKSVRKLNLTWKLQRTKGHC